MTPAKKGKEGKSNGVAPALLPGASAFLIPEESVKQLRTDRLENHFLPFLIVLSYFSASLCNTCLSLDSLILSLPVLYVKGAELCAFLCDKVLLFDMVCEIHPYSQM